MTVLINPSENKTEIRTDLSLVDWLRQFSKENG